MVKLYEVMYSYGDYSDYTEGSIGITDNPKIAIAWAEKYQKGDGEYDEYVFEEKIFIEIHYLNEYYPTPSKAIIQAEKDNYYPSRIYNWRDNPELLEVE